MFIHSDKMIIGADIGGTHITTAIIHSDSLEVDTNSIQRLEINGKSTHAGPLLDQFLNAFDLAISALGDRQLAGISIAMPGPFDYANGIFQLRELDKFNALFGLNFKTFLYSYLPISVETPILFNNDADCFGLGAYQLQLGAEKGKIIGITLGTGFGTSFVEDGVIIDNEPGVPPEGNLFNQPLRLDAESDGQYEMAEDIISARGILSHINARSQSDEIKDLPAVAKRAVQEGNPLYLEAFSTFGLALGTCLAPWCRSFRPEKLVIGGGIMGAADLFMPFLKQALVAADNSNVTIEVCRETELTTIIGAAFAMNQEMANRVKSPGDQQWRKTHQPLLPQHIDKTSLESNVYQIYPYSSVNAGQIHAGFDGLADWMKGQKIVAVDGFVGNDWPILQQKLGASLKKANIRPLWIDMKAFLKSEEAVDVMVAPFLGAETSVWGKKADLTLADFFDQHLLTKLLSPQRLEALSGTSSPAADLVIVFGTGSGLVPDPVPVIYIDLPRNEVQYRMRAGAAANLGSTKTEDFSMMYKRAYFVDWPLLNNHRSAIENRMAIVADGQWREDINWMAYTTLCAGFDKICTEPIRARPWFAPGAWGGDWMKSHIPQLSPAEVNYAWSFELIVPENGLVLESSGNLLEIPFDWLMNYVPKKVLGEDAQTFGNYFPIRFDFLDTYHGGNLSIQCHPALSYIKEQFGEIITQDETYYILDCEPDAGVYLGFQQDIVVADFQEVLENSQKENQPVPIEQYVQFLPSKKHDLFLIPNQTVHSAGINNLVLEISATPYIFTFKMYDWLRPDLNGQPRPINIQHAFKNLDFTRKGGKVQDELCSKPQVLEEKPGFKRIHLPTHPVHFYDIHRLEITDTSLEKTDGKCHILMVVEGQGVTVSMVTETGKEKVFEFAYAETFIIPAAVKQYRLSNHSGKEIKVIKAFIK